MKAYKVSRPESGGGWCIYTNPHDLADSELVDLETGDTIVIRMVEIDEDVLKALPDFGGW